MPERDAAAILEHWEQRARKGAVTIRDVHFRELQVQCILRRIPRGVALIDIGCGNGDNTVRYSDAAREVLGVDFAGGMVAQCREHHRRSNLRFEVDDATTLATVSDGAYDVAVLERCLINLPTHALQSRALAQVARVLRPHGLALLGEVSLQGHARLNRARAMFGLPPVARHWQNLPIDEDALLAEAEREFSVREVVRFSTYEFISKVLHPAIVAPAEPDFLAPINALASRTSLEIAVDAFGDVCKRSLYVLARR